MFNGKNAVGCRSGSRKGEPEDRIGTAMARDSLLSDGWVAAESGRGVARIGGWCADAEFAVEAVEAD
jgi:hypothetical protein